MPRHSNYVPSGVIPAVLLPFQEDLTIDEASWRRHVREVGATPGISALTINAHSTEVASCTIDEQRPEGWVPEQKIRVEEALRAYTSGAARAGFQDKQLGVIAPGMLADLVLIDRDLTRVAPETIRDAKVMLTMVGGRVIYDLNGLTH